MKKIILATLSGLISTSLFAASSCPLALPTDNGGFCPSFKAAATCYCTEAGVPKGLCQDMNSIYKRMLAVFGSVKRACEYQKNTDPQTCIDGWGCYMNGGTDSHGKLCSGTASPCN
jgi:hypothetical protein